jgi:hypothetical protein
VRGIMLNPRPATIDALAVAPATGFELRPVPRLSRC